MNKLKIQNLKFKIFQSPIRNPHSAMGFTLIEIMVVVAILAIISSTLFSVFQGSLLSQRRGTNRALVYSEARAALDMMSREIEDAMVDERIPLECWGMDGGVANSDTFLFFAPLNPDNTGGPYEGELCKVGYWIEEKEIKRGYLSDNNDFDVSTRYFGSSIPSLIGNVSDLQFLYFDGQSQSWTTDGRWDDLAGNPVAVLPRAVKITLVMEYPMEKDRTDTAIFTTVVDIPGSGQ